MNQWLVYFVILNYLEIQNVYELACIRLQINIVFSYLVLSAGPVNRSNNTLCSFFYQNNSESFEQAQHLIAINWKSYKYENV